MGQVWDKYGEADAKGPYYTNLGRASEQPVRHFKYKQVHTFRERSDRTSDSDYTQNDRKDSDRGEESQETER